MKLRLFFLFLIISSAGCIIEDKGEDKEAEEPEIQTQEEASQAMTNISQDIEDVSSILDDIDKSLG
jgi:hypothetical protein